MSTRQRAVATAGGLSITVYALPKPMAIEQGDPGGVSLHEADRVADPVVVVGLEADLVGIDGLRAVYVRD
jgi:hypothetical protein